MQLISSVVALLLTSSALAVPTPVIKRSSTTVLSDLKAISSSISSLATTVSSYNGNLLQSLALAAAVDSLITDIGTATTDTTASTTFSTAATASIVASVTSLTPKIVTLLAGIDAKQTAIDGSGFLSTVVSEIGDIKTDADDLYAALAGKVATAADATSITTLQATADAAFATTSGLFG